MKSCSGTRIALLPLAVVLLALSAACGQLERKAGQSAVELKYYRDLRECAALEIRNFHVEPPYLAIDPGMKSGKPVSSSCLPDAPGGACPAARENAGDAAQISAVDIHALKMNSYRLACMSSKGWQQKLADDPGSEPDAGATQEDAWEWGSQTVGMSCRSHQQCAEDLYCRDEICVAFTTSPWGGMGRDDSCSAYYDCSLGLLCRKGVCTPAGSEISGSSLLPGSRARGARCTDHYQCGTGLLCRGEVCTSAAAVRIEPLGEKPPGASCTAHYQCAKALLCLAGSCK